MTLRELPPETEIIETIEGGLRWKARWADSKGGYWQGEGRSRSLAERELRLALEEREA